MASSELSSDGPDAGDDGAFSREITTMPDRPLRRGAGHRRAQSEILGLPDDISFDSDLGVVGSAVVDGPSFSDEADEDLIAAYADVEKLGGSSTVDSVERPVRVRHQHSQSMDGSASVKPEMLVAEGLSPAEAKKAVAAAKLADLALVDPKRAKRIWANRQSAARSKERKMRYIAELERKVHALQAEAATMSTQLAMLHRDNNSLTVQNNELKVHVQSMEQQVHMQDALNDALREEIQRLKVATGQMFSNRGQVMNVGSSSFGASQQLYNHNQAMQSLLATHQLQQLQLHSQHQQQLQSAQHPEQQHLMGELKMKGVLNAQSQKESRTADSNSVSGE